jgi:hypothetical protein
MLGVPEISRLFDDITKAASKKAESIICNVVLMNAGRRTQVSTGRRLRAAARGGTNDLPSVRDAGHWLANVGTELDWGFQTTPNGLLNGRPSRSPPARCSAAVQANNRRA